MFDNILITQRELFHIGGSEMVSLEICEYFLSQGAKNVFIYTSYYDKPMKNLFKKEKNIKVFTDSSQIDLEAMDLIWIHHQLIPYNLFDLYNSKKIKAKIIFHHMSFYTPLELPIYSSLENKLADLILYNSLETKENINKNFKIYPRSMVLNNPAPDSFMVKDSELKNPTKLSKIRIISNRDYPQKNEIINGLTKQGYKVELFGISGSTYKRITKADITAADLVISIGKTVQYCLLAQKPIYVYDRFGGPGYLNKNNFTKCSHYNFSGRGFEAKLVDKVVNDIVDGFDKAYSDIFTLNKLYAKKYSLSENMQSINKKISKNKKYHYISTTEINSYKHGYDIGLQARRLYLDLDKEHKKLAKHYHKTVQELENKYKKLAEHYHKTVQELHEARTDNDQLSLVIKKRKKNIISTVKRMAFEILDSFKNKP